MLFNSLEFAVFFPIVCALYFALPHRCRTPFLLIASCVFYMAFIPAYILILALTILIDYTAGIYLERTNGRQRTYLLWASILSTCLVLIIFKYFNFFADNLVGLASLFGWKVTNPSLAIVLPIGLSFHTFQSLSYVVEVYHRRQKPMADFTAYATYVMFFPQLVAGPIERPQNLLRQFREKHAFDYGRVTSGLKRMAWGFFKKLVIADRLAIYVNDVFASPQGHNGLQLTLATVFFAYQIYCDFSGYSDIAIGSARVLGFTLMENFSRPYFARSITDFWHRWHISLSTWFRDYVYIPLGGNRVKPSRWVVNILITFGISGLWHGANWTYVVWGLLNGFYVIIGTYLAPVRHRAFRVLGLSETNPGRIAIRLTTTFVLVCAAWVIFRARNMQDAWYVLTHITHNWNFNEIRTEQLLLRQLPVAIAGIAVLELGEFLQGRFNLSSLPQRWPTVPRWAAYASFVVAVLALGIYRNSPFIYFQF